MTPIQISFDSRCTDNMLGTPGTWMPLTVCDYCEEHIESIGNCSVEYHHDFPDDLAFCHKTARCHERYRESRHTLDENRWEWFEMRHFLSAVSNNFVGGSR